MRGKYGAVGGDMGPSLGGGGHGDKGRGYGPLVGGGESKAMGGIRGGVVT